MEGTRWTVPLLVGVLLVGMLLSARPAAAQGSWSGSGTLGMSSTPSAYGSCTGTGSSELSLSGDPSDVEGTLTLDLSSVSPVCSSYFAAGPVSAPVTGTISGSTVYLTDSYGDHFTGTFDGNDLSLSWTSVESAGSGAVCAEFCTTVYSMQMSGTGDLAGGSGAADGLGPVVSDPLLPVAAMGTLVGLAGLGLALSSLPGRGVRPGGGPGAMQGIGRGGFPHGAATGGVGPIYSVGPQYAPAPVSIVGNAPAAPDWGSAPVADAITGGGAGTTGGALAPPPSDICSFISVNGVPLNPNWGDKAVVRLNPANGRYQYYDQHTGEWFWAFPGG